MNFKNFGNEPPGDGGGRTPGNFPLARQSSVYSLTFDEFQNTLGGGVRDFGSMNMDELLKNIWTAEEAQTTAATTASASSMVGGGQEGQAHGGGYLQRQGSLTLPRTLSTKTVDEVWRDLAKESVGVKDGIGVAGGLNFPQAQRQQTLGEMTLEEFLLRAGVVREDAQLQAKPTSTSGYFGDFSRTNPSNISTSVGFGFQQMNQSNGLMGNRINEVNNQASMQSANLPLNVNGVRSNQQQLFMPQIQPQQQQQQQQQQTFPKKPNLAYANPVHMSNGTQLSSPGIRSGIVGMTDTSMNGNLIQNAALPSGGLGMFGLSTAGPLAVATGSPAVSSDGLGKSNGDTSSVSPAPYVFNNGGGRGRRVGNGVEKVIERRQRRMIKNRESAARSRARKQAYTVELEAEVAKLKEENQELRKKQAEILEMRKNQVMEMMNEQQGGAKRQCLRRTQTGPW